MIKIENLHKTFGNLKVLNALDLQLESGKLYAILGPNGSGKTTLIKSILGMVVPEKGTVLINNKNVLGKWVYRNDINYLPQIANFPGNLTVSELIKMVKNLRPKSSEEHPLIDLFDLKPFLNKKLSNLSGGTKQKVNLVLTFMFDSSIIILDEPTTGLDPISLIRLKEIIQKEKERGKTLLVTTHIMSLVNEFADEIVFLLDGKIYFKGSIESLKNQTKEADIEMAIAKLLKQ